MGTTAMRQAREILDNVEHVIAIELLCACQAYDLVCQKGELNAGKGTRAAYKTIRAEIPYLEKDRELYTDIDAVVSLIRSGQIVENVEAAIGEVKGY
jgi:histidine ammonia-lyase